MNEIIISVDEIEKDFRSTLDIEGNTRIFFSGKFGVGKTYFLSSFFETNSDVYDVYHLFPVNYQIHSNDDIINLLKYDIIVELSKKDKNIFQKKKVEGIKESSLLFYSWIKENYSTNQILTSTISLGESLSDLSSDPITGLLGKLGRPLKSLLEIDKQFQEFKEEYKAGEKGLIEKYEKIIRTKNTSELDYISSLIKEKVIQHKENKKSVLVLDDMDRVDPEHIFRILNVLSAHFERDNQNKFGFDTIIVVADYSNLKHMFHHRYGTKTDFDGYIDKFYSITPYYFDNKKAIIARVDEIVKSIRNEDPGLAAAIGESGWIKLFLKHIFFKATNDGLINLRQLLKATKFQLLELRKGGYRKDHFEDNFQKIFDIAVKVAIHSFSNVDVFIEKIETIQLYKDKAKAHMPFDRYIATMLKSLGTVIPEDGSFLNINVNANEQEYLITKSQNGFRLFDVKDNKEEELFYNLLIQYVKEKKHVKNSYLDYDN